MTDRYHCEKHCYRLVSDRKCDLIKIKYLFLTFKMGNIFLCSISTKHTLRNNLHNFYDFQSNPKIHLLLLFKENNYFAASSMLSTKTSLSFGSN
jgi:hypothetical protein